MNNGKCFVFALLLISVLCGVKLFAQSTAAVHSAPGADPGSLNEAGAPPPEPDRAPARPVLIIPGAKVVKGTRSWDIDADSGKSQGAADFWFQHVNERERYVVPKNGAKLAVLRAKDFEKVTLDDLKKAALSDAKLSASDENPAILPGCIVAVRTSAGNYAKLQVTGFVPQSVGERNFPKRHIKFRFVIYRK
ncbi:MAG: hypothetical protein A3J79_03505 [Elusimicrobia bacterium RIFOXYB2_FULL_62_6]|nr:MAG: hypothetical protein A3J79_03505 [Elusimicrobia bacterium RIFOXYB2_FULL_62_6]